MGSLSLYFVHGVKPLHGGYQECSVLSKCFSLAEVIYTLFTICGLIYELYVFTFLNYSWDSEQF
jgi:hypothetical protein